MRRPESGARAARSNHSHSPLRSTKSKPGQPGQSARAPAIPAPPPPANICPSTCRLSWRSGGAEENPADQGQPEGQHRARRIAPIPAFRMADGRRGPGARSESSAALVAAPDQEIPTGAVPQSAEQHRQHEIAVGGKAAMAAAAERDIQVIAQPAGKRNMPAPPEIGDAGGQVRAGGN